MKIGPTGPVAPALTLRDCKTSLTDHLQTNGTVDSNDCEISTTCWLQMAGFHTGFLAWGGGGIYWCINEARKCEGVGGWGYPPSPGSPENFEDLASLAEWTMGRWVMGHHSVTHDPSLISVYALVKYESLIVIIMMGMEIQTYFDIATSSFLRKYVRSLYCRH